MSVFFHLRAALLAVALFSILFIALAPASAWAWGAHKTRNHEPLFRYSVELFKVCLGQAGTGVDSLAVARLVTALPKASEDAEAELSAETARALFETPAQDLDASTVLSLVGAEADKYAAQTNSGQEDREKYVRRALNWHFHHPSRKLRARETDSVKPLSRFMFRVFKSIEDDFESLNFAAPTAREQSMALMARAMHYLEDAVVPAHVVPAYHGLNVSDGIDGYPNTTEIRHGDIHRLNLIEGGLRPVFRSPRIRDPLTSDDAPRLAALCQSLAKPLTANGSLRPLRALLDATAEATRTALWDEKINNDPDTPWHVFWKPPGKVTWFHKFGRYAKMTCLTEERTRSVMFGCPHIRLGDQEIKISPAQYDAFVERRFADAVRADVRALFYLARKVGAAH